MEPVHELSNIKRRERLRKIWWRGLGASVLFHALIFLLFNTWGLPESPFAAAGPRAGDDQAARGSMEAMALSTRPPAPIVRPQIPLPTVNPVEPIEFDPEEVASDLGSIMGDQAGLNEAPGLPTGTGAGDGGTAAEGRFRVTPPTPRGMILPPTNDNLKGKTVEVWVFVDERGRVVADSTKLNPPTSDGSFNRRLIQEASEWVFRPALKGGKPIASWFPYQISM